ncbi:MAG: phosphatidylserine decarboxylase [Bryobacteraceae bacterium]
MVVTGIYYALAFLAGGLLVAWLARPVWGAPMFVLAAFFLWFFRDPERTVPKGPHAVSPADGRVTAVKPDGAHLTRVSIFLSPLDVHVNRTPVGGRIVEAVYKPGEFLVASREEASVRNEQNVITVECDDGVRLTFKQIAGLVARRVVLNKKVGDRVEMGERIGLMQFSSRMDVLFGPEWEILVREGQRVTAGETIIARRKSA